MILLPSVFRWSALKPVFQGMFNLNDGQWGRKDAPSESGQKEGDGDKPGSGAPQGDSDNNRTPPRSGNQGGGNQGPPDLDELWRDFNRKLGGLFGGNKGQGGQNPWGRRGGSGGGGDGPSFQPDMKSAGVGAGLILGVVALIWLGSGFFIVQEGQQAVVTQFGRYHSTAGAGFNWRLPYPVQRHELVFVTQIRSVDVGRDNVVKATGLRESAMLTEDENIVEIKFAVQYRLSDARAFLFESKNPTEAVVQAAETAVREVVGKLRMDSALSEERDQIAPRVRTLMQSILDRYKVGVEVVGINLQQGGVRPPEQVQSAFDDVLKAGQERERSKNEAQAYANDVVPRAVGTASRLKEEADAYKARIVAQAQGDAQRFSSVLAEYQRAPQVTRDRMYIDTMQQIYGNVTKVLVDSRQNNQLLYLPLDKLMQQSGSPTPEAPLAGANAAQPATNSVAPAPGGDSRARETTRSRDRDVR
jgi:modulator of FtsH protease HflK